MLDYDKFVDDMMVSDLPIDRCVMALCEEVGEAAGKVKRLHRGDYGEGLHVAEFYVDMTKELGDILYYLTAAAHSIHMSLEDIISVNVDKLSARKAKGTLRGSGDNR